VLEQRGPWKIDLSLDGDVIHIRPRADLWWHPLEVGCWCQPREETARQHDGCLVLVYVHTAADGRE
jgi:hypothetical protein